jgi:aspartyl-tRNA(Asn)/glutamyl-tRNA(Gln) amidotransferase subunit A
MEALGWHIEEVVIPGWQNTEPIIMDVLLPEAAQIHQQWLGRKSDYAEMTYRQIQSGMEAKAIDYLNGLRDLRRYTDAVSEVFATTDLLMMPTVAFAAPAEDPVIGSKEEDEMAFTSPFNISGHPAVNVNMGFTESGLPVGMQLVAPHFQDIELLRAAHQLERLRTMPLPPLIRKEV